MGRPPRCPPPAGRFGALTSALLFRVQPAGRRPRERAPPQRHYGAALQRYGALSSMQPSPLSPPQPTACASVSPFAHLGSQRGHPPTPPPAQWGPPHAIGTHRDPPPPKLQWGHRSTGNGDPAVMGTRGPPPHVIGTPLCTMGTPPPPPWPWGPLCYGTQRPPHSAAGTQWGPCCAP